MRRDLQAAMVRVAAVGVRVMPDAIGVRAPGRGGYLHRTVECMARFERSKVREFRSLRRKLATGERRELTELIKSRLASSAQLD